MRLAGAIVLGRDSVRIPLVLVNLSGRGDKDVATAAKWFGLVKDQAAIDGAESV